MTIVVNHDKFNRLFLKSNNRKVLLMLSGGKDSSACLNILCNQGVDVTAIHFTHRWGAAISTGEARRICRELNVRLIEIDFSDDFFSAIQGYKGGRPCLLCKPEMYKHVIRELEQGDYGWVCIGDNANDTTTIARLENYINDKANEDQYCSTYFGSERGIVLPPSIKVLRPILDLEAEDVEHYLESCGIKINKNYSTGDKYFEYAREGCPVQFHDPGYDISEQTLSDLHHFNTLLSDFAKLKDIRASVHLPSTFIVTIPTGFEIEAALFLEKNGLAIDWDVNTPKLVDQCTIIRVKIEYPSIIEDSIYRELYLRFIERIHFDIFNSETKNMNNIVIDIFYHCSGYIMFRLCKITDFLTIEIQGGRQPKKLIIKNLIIEIFRTRKYHFLVPKKNSEIREYKSNSKNQLEEMI